MEKKSKSFIADQRRILPRWRPGQWAGLGSLASTAREFVLAPMRRAFTLPDLRRAAERAMDEAPIYSDMTRAELARRRIALGLQAWGLLVLALAIGAAGVVAVEPALILIAIAMIWFAWLTAFLAFQVKHRIAGGLRRFMRSPSEWVPLP